MQNTITRRNFVQAAGSVAAVAATGTMATAAHADEETWDYEADVVVVGFGGAGAVSAITAHDLGAKVIVVEKQAQDTDEKISQLNSTRQSHSCMDDFHDVEGAIDFMKAAFRGATPDDVIEEFAKYCVGTMDYVNNLGCRMYDASDSDTSEYPYEVFPQGANYTACLSEGMGEGYWKDIEAAVFSRDVEVLFETPALELISDGEGAVIGVVCEQGGKQVRVKGAKGVILACGGFEFDFEMQARCLTVNPCRFNGNPGNTGDGIRMAQRVGADLWHMALIGGEPIPFIEELNVGCFWYGVEPDVWVDKYGRRFAPGPVAVNNSEPGALPMHTASQACFVWDFEKCDFARAPFWTVMDQKALDNCPVLFSATLNLTREYTFSSDYQAEVEKGWLLKADTLEELAELIGADPDNAGKMAAETLVQTIETFNGYCADGFDPDLNTQPRGLVPVDQPPYYALKMYPGCYNTFGGPRRDPRGRILNADGEAIPGLFGAGELGSVMGFLYVGGGWNIMEGVASGRIAAEEAVASEPRA